MSEPNDTAATVWNPSRPPVAGVPCLVDVRTWLAGMAMSNPAIAHSAYVSHGERAQAAIDAADELIARLKKGQLDAK